ncbi:MAG: hypothetical protein SFW67_33070 [Myxococcaceae bacterium]|nr:hypothetical protein [Myxococcaceae bacterium]
MRWRTWVLLVMAGCGVATIDGPAPTGDAGSPYFSGGLGGAGGGSTSMQPEGGGGAELPGDAGPFDAGPPDAGVAFDAGFTNAPFTLPDAGGLDAGAMTCAWLDGPNCWKQQADRFRDCGLPVGVVGRLTPDGRSCTFDGGVVIDFSGDAPERPDSGTSLWITALRVRTGSGSCFETAYTLGRSRFRAGSVDVYSHNTSLLTYEIICPDGRRYDNVRENGACDTFGLRYLGGGVPGHDVACDATECRVLFNGTSEGRRIAARCLR